MTETVREPLKDRVALVTGAGRGIGAATAVELAARGAKVVLAARTEKELLETASAIALAGGTALPVRCDVTREEEVARLFREARERLGPVSLLVNNAGTAEACELASMSLETWRRNIDANLTSTFLCSRAALPDMLAARSGRIVNVASVAGVSNVPKFPGFVAYASAKAAVIAFTETLAAEVGPGGVQVFCVSPGSVATALLARVAPDAKASLSPVQVARAIAAVLSDDAAPASGTNLIVWGR